MDDLTRLALAARDGDRGSLAELVARTQADVWRLCAYLVSPAEADDLAQEVFVRAIGSLAGFRGESGIRPWLLTVARRTCADALRRRKRLPTTVPLESEPSTSDSAVGSIELWSLLHDLSADQRAAFVVTQLLGLSYHEAGETLGCPVGTIRSRVARARDSLIEAWGVDLRSQDG